MNDSCLIAFEPTQPAVPPVVSIITATKNCLARLQRFVSLADGFSTAATEVIVVDGGSQDGTTEWLALLTRDAAKPWLTAVSEPDSGIAEAWNRGIRLAQGQWVVFLGADDRVTDAEAWRLAIDRLESLPPECGVAAFPVRMVTAGGTIVADEDPRLGSGGRRFPAVNTIPHQGAFHRRSLWEAHGDFDTSFAIAADYEFLLRVWSAGVEIRVCDGPPPVAMTFGGTSKRNLLKNLKEFRCAQRMHGIRLSPLQRGREWGFATLRSGAAAVLGESVARRLADWGRWVRGLPPVWGVS